MELKEKIDLGGKLIAAGSLVFAVLVYFSDRNAVMQERKIERSFERISLHRTEIAPLERKLDLALRYYTIWTDINEPSNVDDRKFKAIAKEFFEPSLDRDADKSVPFLNFDHLNSFYAESLNCIKATHCDEVALNQYLCDHASAFLHSNRRLFRYASNEFLPRNFESRKMGLELYVDYCTN